MGDDYSLIITPEMVMTEWEEKLNVKLRKKAAAKKAKVKGPGPSYSNLVVRKNWHDTTEKKRLATWKRNDLFRAIIVGIHRGTGDEFCSHVDRMIRPLAAKYSNDAPTGILLTQNGRFIHILEGMESMLTEFMKLANDDLQAEDSMHEKAVVVWYWNNLIERVVKRWVACSMGDIPGIHLNPKDLDLKTVIIEFVKTLMKMSYIIGQQPVLLARDYMEKQPRELLVLYPQASIVDYFMLQKDILTIPSFLATYNAIQEVEYYGDLVDPLPCRRFPYD